MCAAGRNFRPAARIGVRYERKTMRQHRRRWTRLFASFVAVSAVLAGSIGPAAITAGASTTPPATTWSIEPADAAGADGRVSMRHTIDPGATIVDRVVVTNYGAAPASFGIYASDGIVTDAGDFDLLQPGQDPQDGGSWILIGNADGDDLAPRHTVELAADSSAIFTVSITVPANATPGDHPAGVVAQLVSDGSAVDVIARTGVRAHIRVAGDVRASFSTDATNVSYVPSWNPFVPGTLQMSTELTNDGNVRMGADAIVTAAGPFGALPIRQASEVREVLPGQSTTIETSIDVWPMFFLWGNVRATPVVVGEDQVNATLSTSQTEFGVWAVPWALLILVLLLVGAVQLFVRVRRTRTLSREERFRAAVDERARSLADAREKDDTSDGDVQHHVDPPNASVALTDETHSQK